MHPSSKWHRGTSWLLHTRDANYKNGPNEKKTKNSCNENGSHLEGVSSVSLPGFAASSYSTTRGQMIRFFFFLFEVAPVVGFGSNDELME